MVKLRQLLISTAALAYATSYAPTAADVAMVRSAARSRGVRGSDDPMLSRSDDIAAMVDYWDQTDSIIDGIKAMRLGREMFLPMFNDEEIEGYESRLQMTKMTNVYRDIVESLAAKPFEREVDLEGDEDEQLEAFEHDVDGAGNNLSVFANTVFFNGINSAIDWIHVDFPQRDPNIRTLADYRAAGLRPYWSRVLARNVLAAESKMIGGVETLIYIKMFEPGKPAHVREFKRADNGVISWVLYVDSGVKSEETRSAYVVQDAGTLSVSRIPMIPFVTGRRDGRTWKIFPALQDAADLQVELYQQESGLKFAKTLTAYPMLAGNGIKPAMELDGKTIKKLRVGPNRVLYAPPDGGGNIGSWAYVEPSSESLKFLAADIEATIKELRELGRQPLTVQSMNLTKETTQVAAGKAKSAIKQWAVGLKNALQQALELTLEFLPTPDDLKLSVNVFTEFDEVYNDKSLEALAKDRERSDLSRKTYWKEMKRRGQYSADFDAEEEVANLLAELPGDSDEDPVPPKDDEE